MLILACGGRCTIVTTKISAILGLVQAILASPDVMVVRMKHRLYSEYDAAPLGGYLDCQLQVVFRGDDGQWHNAEVQVCVPTLVIPTPLSRLPQ